jgi:guanylate kinase
LYVDCILSFAAVESVQQAGKVCVLDIDIQGVKNVKMSNLDPLYIFIAPPSMEVLEARLRGRATEKEEDISKRLANARTELAYGNEAGNFDRVFINASLKACFEDMALQFQDWYSHLDVLAPDDDELKTCNPCVPS